MSMTIQVRVARERSLPFDPSDKASPPHAPNEETVAAIKADRGELVHVGHPSDLIAELDAD